MMGWLSQGFSRGLATGWALLTADLWCLALVWPLLVTGCWPVLIVPGSAGLETQRGGGICINIFTDDISALIALHRVAGCVLLRSLLIWHYLDPWPRYPCSRGTEEENLSEQEPFLKFLSLLVLLSWWIKCIFKAWLIITFKGHFPLKVSRQ